VADTGSYPARYRDVASIPQTSPDSVSLITTESVCAVLQAKFARVATARDTLAPNPVYVVGVASSKFLVTDLKVEGTVDAIHVGDQRMEVATMTVALDSVRMWKYNPVPSVSTPY